MVIEGNHRTFNIISQLFRIAIIFVYFFYFVRSNITNTHLKSSSNTDCQTNTMSRQAKDMFHECKEIPNSPPNIFLNETRRPTIDSTTESDHYKYIFGQPLRNFMIWRTLKQLLKNEDVLKMARNEIAKLIRTVNFLLQK